MKKEQIESILTNLLSTGGDFAEVFHEESCTKIYRYINQRLNEYTVSMDEGIGLRLAKENKLYTGEGNNLDESSINELVCQLKKNFSFEPLIKKVTLEDLTRYKNEPIIDHSDLTEEEILEKLRGINNKIWEKDKRIAQVNVSMKLDKKNITIANQTGLYKKEERMMTKIVITIQFNENEKKSSVHFSASSTSGFEIFDTFSMDEKINELIKTGLDKLYAVSCTGGYMPVVIEAGFGGTLFHEACGHALEAEYVSQKRSVFTNDFNQKIASEKVTLIDDGTILSECGTTLIDDEGTKTQKNILIKDGVLVGYLVDTINGRKMNYPSTASSRRESYQYSPTARMNNTYLAAGTDKIEDMFKGIKLGLYAARVGGGCVDPETGDFNFNVGLGYMIRDGKISECVKTASLIGNSKELLKEVEMVGDNLKLDPGLCGASSGWVPVNVGQPTIKIGHILVGGEKSNDK